MSSPSESSSFQASNEPFQSAQAHHEEIAMDEEDLNLASENLSRVTSPDPAPNRQRPFEVATNTFRGENFKEDEATDYEKAHGAVDDGHEECSPVSSPPPLRPNKYRGPASTWRNWTALERDLTVSLDQLTAKDLSAHLYNVFKLKRNKNSKQKVQQQEPDDGESNMYDADSWVPPRVWTAWPLPPETVPREEEERKWGQAVLLPPPYIVRPKLPGNMLRELLEAEVLRKAKLKFTKRDSVETNKEFEEPTDMKPVVMADDEQAGNILRPTIQNILAKLDSLLVDLHYARRACLTFDESRSESQSRSRGRPVSRTSSRKRKRAVSRNDTDAEIALEQTFSKSETVATIASKSSRLMKTFRRLRSSSRFSTHNMIYPRKSRLGPRDWSDVLGVASMTGWDSGVVQRAVSRCASLFEEGIMFRTLEEEREGHSELCYKPGASWPVFVTKDDGADQKVGKGMFGGVHVNGFLEPIEGRKSWKYQAKGSGRGRGRP